MTNINIRDIVKYKTAMNPNENWGIVRDIFEIKDSMNESNKGRILYRIQPLDHSGILSHYDAIKDDIIDVYRKQDEEESITCYIVKCNDCGSTNLKNLGYIEGAGERFKCVECTHEMSLREIEFQEI